MAKNEARKVYERPAVVEIGSLAELTEFGPGDRHNNPGRNFGRGHDSHGRGLGLGHHKGSSHYPDS
ncbi:lasso RiPP family leader peptide-containing protein [Vreelandella nanhaiensis]|uniref:Lasso RiPP family leader peptide-containing protein n=1 Tax=Vreelandella nanhaiensis TaxID=1258546 RepID=A0A433KP11_9GAMM|nr:lasso RiPP family leader peptide-containing protein [Halomonas nanhaiensis]RUR31322.1 lasso RiPP family leader peptide-containing protein [Halomonas nanhaiensis]